MFTARLRLKDGVDGEERRLGLDVVHVGRIVDAGVAHRGVHPLGDLLDHRRPADVFRQNLGAHRGADDETRFPRHSVFGVARENRRMRGYDAVAAARPDHRNLGDLLFRAAAEPSQHCAKRLIGENAGKIVDAAVAFGLADDGDDLIGVELSVADASLHARSILHVLQFDFGDLDSHYA